MSCSRTQHGGGRYRTPDLSLRSPTLYHWATALPWYKFWQHFKAFTCTISIILYQFQKDPFCLIILYDILFYFTHVYIAHGQGKQPVGTIVLMEAERSYHFDIWLHFSKTSLPSDVMHILIMILYIYIAPAGADNPLGTKFWCQQKGLITLVICCKFKKHLFNLWFYTHLFMIL